MTAAAPHSNRHGARHSGFWERLHRGAAVINQRALSETEICNRIIVRGRLVSRGRRKRADYLLVYEGVPLMVVSMCRYG
jgi:hypothetical protein